MATQQSTQEQPQTEVVSGPLYPLVPPDPAQGAPIYAEECAPCHGENGLGQESSAAERNSSARLIGDANIARNASPAEWFAFITNGSADPFMPAFANLSERQRWDVAAYSFSLSETPETIALGRQLYQANCTRCHGVSGQGDGSATGELSAPAADLTRQSEAAERSMADLFQMISTGVPPSMPAFSGQLGEEERWAVSAYLRTLGFVGAAAASVSAEPAAVEVQSLDEQGQASSADEVDQVIPTGSVAVNVINGSSGLPPDDIEVILYSFDNMQIVYSQTLTNSVGGIYVFENVPLASEQSLIASALYQNAMYTSEIIPVDDPLSPPNLDIVVYEATTDLSALLVDRLHIFFDFSAPDLVQVVEVFVISNMGNKTIIAAEEGGAVTPFKLPEGASNLQMQDGELGERYVSIPGGFADTLAVRPASGEYQVVFAFELPYERKLSLAQPLDLPVTSVVLMLPDNGIKVKGENFSETGTRDIQGSSYRVLTSASLPAGSQLRLDLSGKPGGSGVKLTTNSNTGLVIGLGALGLALIVSGLWLFMRSRKAVVEEDTVDVPEEADDIPYEDEEALMDAIIALDDLYKDGKLPEEAYQERRAALKERLQEILGKTK